MPKQIINGSKISIVFDETKPKDKALKSIKSFKGKDLKTLTYSEKIKLFDLLVDTNLLKL